MAFPLVVRALVLGFLFSAHLALSADDATNATAPDAAATPAPIAEPEKKIEQPAPTEPVTFPLKEPEPIAAEPVPIVPPKPPQIALLLPLKSATFGRAAEAVRDGFIAASHLAGAESSLPIEVYDSENKSENLLTLYNRILNENAKIVVGPMTRSDVTQIARSGMVTALTLALNIPEGDGALPKLFYSLNLSQEAEARQLANIAYARGLRRAAIVTSQAALAKRTQSAFASEWLKLGGTTTLEYAYSSEARSLAEFRTALKAQQVNVVFIAADATVARKIRPHIKATIPAYATSQVLHSKTDTALNVDLKGLHFVDMPWLIKPDHSAVMAYPAPKKSLSAELQRFYALGIDAFRLAQALLRTELPPTEPMEGVSGRITLTAGHLFSRDLLQATFDESGAVKTQEP
jgi:uncharacterized protein